MQSGSQKGKGELKKAERENEEGGGQEQEGEGGVIVYCFLLFSVKKQVGMSAAQSKMHICLRAVTGRAKMVWLLLSKDISSEDKVGFKCDQILQKR